MIPFKKDFKRLSFPDFCKKHKFQKSGKEIVFILLIASFTILILLLPTGFKRSELYSNAVFAKVRILEVDNSLLRHLGVVNYGSQKLKIEIISGNFKNNKYETSVTMTGSIDKDKIFEKGDIAHAQMNVNADGNITIIQVLDHYRSDKTLILSFLFIIAVIMILGKMGLKIILTFIFSMAMLVKVLYPLTLRGFDPIIGGLIISILITAGVIFLVGNITKRAFAAFLGSVSGLVFTAIISFIFTFLFKLSGGTQAFSQNLTYIGFEYINLSHLFIAGIFIAASGAMMDMAMGISAAMDEVKEQKPDITRKDLMKSGFVVSRQAAGTMVTTLLLAYSAEYTAMIMYFVSQNIPFENIINNVLVSQEVVHTLVGCFGLTLVAPFTVFAASFLLAKDKEQK